MNWLRCLLLVSLVAWFAPAAQADKRNFDFAGKLYTKWLYQNDDSQLCAILTGSGDKAFAAGADIKPLNAAVAVTQLTDPNQYHGIAQLEADFQRREAQLQREKELWQSD